jgi:hypothetical protein
MNELLLTELKFFFLILTDKTGSSRWAPPPLHHLRNHYRTGGDSCRDAVSGVMLRSGQESSGVL